MLFGALAGGALYALRNDQEFGLAPCAFRFGQGLLGATIGALFDPATLGRLADHWQPVALVVTATLVVGVLLGQLLRFHSGVTAVTGGLGMLAGGASSVSSVARELGADEHVVSAVQYVRILLVLLTVPVLVPMLASGPTEPGQGVPAAGAGWASDGLFVVISVALGLLAAGCVRLPTSALFGPLLVAALLSSSPFLPSAHVPPVLQGLGYAVVGVQIGLRLTPGNLRSIVRLLPLAVLLISVLIASCVGMGLFLAQTTGVTALDAYLATTPGGLYAVLAVAAESGGDITFVLGVQLVRVLVMVLITPFVARLLRRP